MFVVKVSKTNESVIENNVKRDERAWFTVDKDGTVKNDAAAQFRVMRTFLMSS